MNDELKEFYEKYDYAKIARILETAPLYGWEKECVFSAFIRLREEIRQAYKYHTMSSETKE